MLINVWRMHLVLKFRASSYTIHVCNYYIMLRKIKVSDTLPNLYHQHLKFEPFFSSSHMMESIYLESKVHESEVYKFFSFLDMIIVTYFYILKKCNSLKKLKLNFITSIFII